MQAKSHFERAGRVEMGLTIELDDKRNPMKITNTSIETLPSSSAGAASGVQAAQQAGSARSYKTDSVNVSSASQLLNLAKASAAPDRSAKVSSVAAALRSGQYSSDIASVSQALVGGHIQ